MRSGDVMKLGDVMNGVAYRLQNEAGAGAGAVRDLEVSAVVYDSRKAVPGCVFVCIRGSRVDGHDFAGHAAANGAVACVVERPVTPQARASPREPVQLVVGDSRKALARMAYNLFENPSSRMTLVGVVGTNGKTTTTYLVKAILEAAGRRVGLLGTVGNAIGDRVFPAVNTTPESLDIQAFLNDALGEGARHAVMEVSSHAIALERVAGVEFDVGVFTNITHDHLDFHGTFQNYLEAKSKFFADLGHNAWGDPKGRPTLAVVNADDPNAHYVAARSRAPVIAYAVEDESRAYDCERGRLPGEEGRLTARKVSLGARSTVFEIHADGLPEGLVPVRGRTADGGGHAAPGGLARLGLVGTFNVYNALGAIGAGLACGVDLETALRGAGRVRGVPGRFETVDEGQEFGVIVDYAHTPDGLFKVLQAARSICSGRLVVVFGCGGDRDRKKRPEMGAIAARGADTVVVTSDNPRSEDPQAIIDEIRAGVEQSPQRHADPAVPGGCGGGGDRASYHEIPDRRSAIRHALGLAGPGDIVVIAGKGHETYQILRDRTIPFDDRLVARETLRELGVARGDAGGPPGAESARAGAGPT